MIGIASARWPLTPPQFKELQGNIDGRQTPAQILREKGFAKRTTSPFTGAALGSGLKI
jgi:hypothetical protein